MGTVRNGVYYSDYNGDEIDNLLDKTVWQSNPNLLDNWYFVGGGSQQGGGQFPINQRAYTPASITSWKYTIDRWKTLGRTEPYAGIDSDGRGFIPKISLQPLESSVVGALSGKTKTLSCLCADGTFVSLTTTSDSTESTQDGITLGYGVTGYDQGMCFELFTAKTVVAVKLELGDKSTLAHKENGVWVLNEVPNYQEQLARCQRYQEASSAFTYQVNGSGTFDFSVPFKVAKRNSGFPVTVYSNAGTPNAISVWTSNGWADVPIQSPVSGDYVTREDSFRLLVPNVGAYAPIEFRFFADANL